MALIKASVLCVELLNKWSREITGFCRRLLVERNTLAELICSVISLALAFAVAVVQYCQSKRMEEFERRQDERDERRHAEGNKARAIEFISKHYADRGLIPLCAVAAMHNDLFHYSRKMYWEFCCLVPEVQNLILKYCNLDLRVRGEDDLFVRCIAAVEAALRDRFPEDEPVLYDDGKYVLRSLERYAGRDCQHLGLAFFLSAWTLPSCPLIAVPRGTITLSVRYFPRPSNRGMLPSPPFPI